MLEAEASRDICEYDSIDFESLLHEQAKQHWFPDPLCIPDSSWLHSLQLSSLPLHSGRTWTEENGWNDGPVFVPSVALATKRSSRHSRFGTSMQTVAADGTLNAWILKTWKFEGEEVLLSMWGHRSMLLAKRFQHRWCKRASSRRAARVKPKLQLLKHSCH